jgi:hypothetical protein
MTNKLGSIRLGNKRKNSGTKIEKNEIVIHFDRTNPILGNPHILHNHNDNKERAEVIAKYKIDLDLDFKIQGPKYRECKKIAQGLQEGKNFIGLCWCSPWSPTEDRDCHGKDIIEKINELANKN